VWRRLPAVGLMFRGALARLAAQYFVLLVLILGCFDLIVYFTVSQALQAKADNDLRLAVGQANKDFVVIGDTVTFNGQGLLDPSVADTFIRVLDINGQEQGRPRPALKKLFDTPRLSARMPAAKAGRTLDARTSNATDLY